MKIFSKKIFSLIIVLGLFLPIFNAQAIWFLDGIAYSAVANIFAFVSFIMFTAVGKFMAIAVDLLYWAVNIRIYTNVPVILESWKIMRDFANMLFIIALVVMAYGTIFNISGYDFRSLIAKFLIAALLINFSLVIGGLIIDGTQILNNTFLNAMGDISAKLGQGMEPWKLLPTEAKESGEAFASLLASSFVTILFALFLAVVFLISVSVPLVMAFIRIPILWALLIISPMAWLLSILPATRSIYDKWWHQFLAWTLFLPYYLFFLYFALYFLSKKNEVLAGLGQTFVDDKVTGMTGLQSEFTFGLIFYYSLVAVFLIGGTKVAMNAGRFSGTGIVGVARWGRGQTMRYLGVTAVQRGAQQKLDELKKEGLPGYGRYLYGGERGIEAKSYKYARILGTKGALEKGIEIEKEKQKPFTHNITELQRLADSGGTEQKLAARMRLTELNALDRTRINQTYQWLGGDRSEAANKYVGGIDFGKFSTDDRKLFSQSLTNIEALKKNAMAMLEKDKLDVAQINELVQKLGTRDTDGNLLNVGDIKDILEKGNKKNLLAIAQTKVALAIDGAKSIDIEIEKAFKKMSDDQIIETMNDPSFNIDEIFNKQPVIRHALHKVLGSNPKRLENLAVKSSGEVQSKLDRMAKAARRVQNMPKIADLTKKKQSIIPQITQGKQDLIDIDRQINLLESQVNPNNPTSSQNLQLRQQINLLDKQRTVKDGEVKSLSDKIDKIDERINNIKSGTS